MDFKNPVLCLVKVRVRSGYVQTRQVHTGSVETMTTSMTKTQTTTSMTKTYTTTAMTKLTTTTTDTTTANVMTTANNYDIGIYIAYK